MNQLAVDSLIQRFEMRNLERAHRLDRHGEGAVDTGRLACCPQPPPCRTERPQNLRPIKALPLAMITKAHRVSLRRNTQRLHSIRRRSGAVAARV